MSIRSWFFMRRHMKACRRLQRITEERCKSFAVQDFAKRRAAMLKVTRSLVETS